MIYEFLLCDDFHFEKKSGSIHPFIRSTFTHTLSMTSYFGASITTLVSGRSSQALFRFSCTCNELNIGRSVRPTRIRQLNIEQLKPPTCSSISLASHSFDSLVYSIIQLNWYEYHHAYAKHSRYLTLDLSIHCIIILKLANQSK